MLKDDITGGVSWLVDRTKRFIGGAIKGALVFGALAVVGYGIFLGVTIGAFGVPAFAASAYTAAGTLSATSVLGGIAHSAISIAAGIFTAGKIGLGFAAAKAGTWAALSPKLVLGSAVAGSAATAVASVVPSVKTWFRSSPSAPSSGEPSPYTPAPAPSQAISQNPDRAQHYQFDNPYAQEGLGAKLVARGNQPSQTLEPAAPTRA